MGSLDVLRALVRKRLLLLRGDPEHENIRVGILGGDGLLLGVNGAGCLCALQDEGLMQAFEVVVGVSTSIPMLGFSLAHQAKVGADVYCEECATADFLNVRRRKYPMDIDYLSRVFQKKLDQAAVLRSRPHYLAYLRNLDTGANVLFDMKKQPQFMIDAMRAGIAIPRWTQGEVIIDGVRYGDARPSLPIKEIIGLYELTHLLVLMNYPIPVPGETTWDEEVSCQIKSALSQKECRVAIVSGSDSKVLITPFERDAGKLRQVANNAEAYLRGVL